jgi:glycogen operon protein
MVSQHQGNFPKGWAEWNDRYRNTSRRFLRGDSGQIADLGWRLTGSEDMYSHNGRNPTTSINFITCHDGFTLNDMFSYNRKHNLDNGERNRDGTNDNFSWNCGQEGETDDPAILKLRKKMVKNALFCLFFSAGTPMLLGGDEWMRTQGGNNNAYCQDNEISWFNWEYLGKNRDLLDFVKTLIAFRKNSTVLKRTSFYTGRDTDNDGLPDIAWFDKNRKPPSWQDPIQKCLCFLLNGKENPNRPSQEILFVILNAENKSVSVTLPELIGKSWYRLADTSLETGGDIAKHCEEIIIEQQKKFNAAPRSTVVLRAK